MNVGPYKMKAIAIVLALVSQLTVAIEVEEKFHSIESKIWDTIAQADVELFYYQHAEKFVKERKYDRTKKEFEGKRLEIEKKDLPRFLRKQTKTKFAVVTIEKNVLSENELKVVISELLQVFQHSGYERILVLGAHGAGVIEYCDFRTETETEKPNKSRLDNPLPRRESDIEPS